MNKSGTEIIVHPASDTGSSLTYQVVNQAIKQPNSFDEVKFRKDFS